MALKNPFKTIKKITTTMKIKWILPFAIAGIALVGCKNSDADAIATDMCGCFNMLKDSLPPEGLKVFEKAAASATPQATFEEEMKKLPIESALKVNAALMSTSKPASPINDCIKELDKKYKTPANTQQEMAQKMIDALKDKKGCEIMMALMRMNQKK